MRFYGLHQGYYEGVQRRQELFQSVCDSKGIEFVCLDSLTCDYTSLPKLGRKNLLYNFASGSQTGSRGIGTIKIDSWPGLHSTVDYLMSIGDKFIMRQFIQADYGARIMVLGDEVILSAKFLFQENDFRNAPVLSATRYEPMHINTQIEEMCVKAVKLANLEMAGVDLLFDKYGNPYLLEINFPTGFQSFKDNPQPILDRLIDHLINKSKRNGQ